MWAKVNYTIARAAQRLVEIVTGAGAEVDIIKNALEQIVEICPLDDPDIMSAPVVEVIETHVAAIDAVGYDGNNCSTGSINSSDDDNNTISSSSNNNDLNNSGLSGNKRTEYDSGSDGGEDSSDEDDSSSDVTQEEQEELETWEGWEPASASPGIDEMEIKLGLISAVVAVFCHVIGSCFKPAPVHINPQDPGEVLEYRELVS